MRTRLMIALVFLMSNSTLNSQQGWFWLNPTPQGNSLNSSAIVNTNTAYAMGDFGALLKTTNNGTNWSLIYTNINRNFSSIYFLNQQTGYGVGGLGTNVIAKTTNGGNNWLLLNPGIAEWLKGVYFFDDNTGIVCGDVGRIIKTTNEGNTWILKNSGTMNFLGNISFAGQSTCYIPSSNLILKTTDMGESWTSTLLNDTIYNISYLFFLNQNTGYGVGSSPSRIIKTTNGGNNWIRQNPGTSYRLNMIYFLNENTGFVSGGDGSNAGFILKTTNGGDNWFVLNSDYKYALNSVNFFNQNVGYAVGVNGGLTTTTNGGFSWEDLRKGTREYLNTIWFVNSQTGYLGGYDKKLYKSTNGGVTWEVNLNLPTWVNTLYFLNENTGYLGGGESFYTGIIYKTTNAGDNWISQTYFEYREIKSIVFPNEFTGYANFSTNILKTTNGGTNWEVKTALSSSINSIYFTDALTGYGVGGVSRIIKTTNGGDNWSLIYSNGNNLSSICFVNNTTGFCPGLGRLLRTTNAGLNWVETAPTSNHLTSIFFANVNTGYVVGRNKIFKTTDCGLNWNEQICPAFELLRGVYFVNASTGFTVGEDGTVLKTTSGGIVGINNNSQNLLNTFLLSQNYPNPFNPVTNIKFDIPLLRGVSAEGGRGVLVKLIIYDLLGREITQLVNQQMQPGSYSVDWDGSNYPSGVYFYSIVVGDNTNNGGFTETKKMVLVK